MDIEFTCKFCLETHVVEDALGKHGIPQYPEVCPHCRTTKCSECGGILKAEPNYCQHCGEVDPELMSMMVRTSSTSAAYAEQNWTPAVKRFNDSFGELEDEDHRYEIWTDLESGDKVMKETTVEDGERVVLSERKL